MNAGDSAVLFAILIWLGIVLIIFLICREILCCYFKTNRIESKIDEIEGLLRGIKNSLRNNPPSEPKAENQK